MQEIWKENISGYNQKGNKRKKQSRKHTLKDKAKVLIKKFAFKNIDNDVIYNDSHSEFGGFANNNIFINGTQIPYKYYFIFGFWSTKRRKDVQKIANRITRAKAQQWLSKKDYEMNSEIENHLNEKSISRAVH